MNNSIFISIITVTRNNLGGLARTYRSTRQQTEQDFEWIVIDGASEDETPEFLSKTPAHWTSEPDKGIYDAMNKGIERCKGQYILFLNAGDTLAHPDTLMQLKNAATYEAALLYGDSYEDKKYKPAKNHTSILTGLFTHHQAILYKRAAIKDLRYDLYYEIAADYDFTARFLIKTQQNALYCPIPVCNFESGGLSQQRVKTGRKEQFEIRKKLKLCTLPANLGLYAGQSVMWKLRQFAPNLYWHLKSSGNKQRGFARNQNLPLHPKNQALEHMSK